ncbi:hypothetical protein ACH4YO_28565 [Streptomyces noursei]|uniref:hypothetical protein n=1 Tax=Streptomyces noursei TaxID=1971 RepID=UPI0033F82CB3
MSDSPPIAMDVPPAAACGTSPTTALRGVPSPLIPRDETDTYEPFSSPIPHTDADLSTLLGLLLSPPVPTAPGSDGLPGAHHTRHSRRRRPSAPFTVTIGHSRDDASIAAAAACAEAWRAAGRTVLAVVDWPEHAASWLLPARRFTADRPDAWVVAAAPLGWAQMSRRLRHSTDWEPARTYGFASLGDSRLVALAGPATLQGMRGVSADGGTWLIDRGWVTRRPPGTPPAPSPGGP